MVRVTGLEPAATTCGARKLLSAWSAGNFRPLRLFALAVSHTVSARAQSLTPRGQSAAIQISIIQNKKPKRANAHLGFLVRVTGLEPAAS